MVTKNEVSELNKHIIAVSGTQHDFFGFTNEGNLDYAINKANHQTNIIDQATTLMHEIVRGQPFTNANKRTGFETLSGALVSKGYMITATSEEIINFTNRINIEGMPVGKVKEWITTNSEFTGDKTNFVEASFENVIKDKEMLKKMD